MKNSRLVKISEIRAGDVVSTPNLYTKDQRIDPEIQFTVTRVVTVPSKTAPSGEAVSLYYHWFTWYGEAREEILTHRHSHVKILRHNK